LTNDAATVVAFLTERIVPAPPVDEQPLERAMAALDAPKYADREQAQRELEAAGERAGPLLHRRRAASTSAESRRRIEQLLDRIERGEPDPEQRRLLRAIAVLEHHGSAEAAEALKRLAKGTPGARITTEAEESLQRIKRQ
jgi:hypothetical protein